MSKLFVFLALLGTSCRTGTGSTLHAQHPEVASNLPQVPSLTVTRLNQQPITVDGDMSDPGWANAATTDNFVLSPNGNADPRSPVNAFAKVAWDATYLYFGFVIRDKNPTSPFSVNDVDPHVWEQSSAAELMIQPGDPGNNKHYYEIQVDVNGAVWDTKFDDYNEPIGGGPDPSTKTYGHQAWDSKLKKDIVVNRDKGNFVVEIAIPWTSLSSPQADAPPKPGDVWRINMYSFRDGQRHSMAWSPILRQGNFHKSLRFGRVTFVDRPAM